MSQGDAINSGAAELPDWLQSVIDIPDPPHEDLAKLQRISPILRENNEEYYKNYYTPMVVPIGPIHCRNLHGQSMKDLKQKAVRELAETAKDKVSIGQVYASVEEKLLSARNRYSCDIIESFRDDGEWCKMMFLDGCFVVDFICNYMFLLMIFGRRSLLNMRKYDTDMVLRDLYLYENQLPFEVLDALADAFGRKEHFHNGLNGLLLELPFMLTTSSVPAPRFLDYIDSCFCIKFTRRVKQLNQIPRLGKNDIPAASHLLQYYLIRLNSIFGRKAAYSPPHKGRRCSEAADDSDDYDDVAATDDSDDYDAAAAAAVDAVDSASFAAFLAALAADADAALRTAGARRPLSTVIELKKVGIKCSGSTSLLDISFYSNMLSGKLFLPQLTFDRWSKTLILNLAAYEFSCSPKYGSSGISSYLSSIGMFIHGEEDVKELRARGLVQLNSTDDDDHAVVDFFRYIKAHHEPNPKVIRPVKQQIFDYCKSKRLLPLRVAYAEFYAEFTQRYFSGPWRFLVFLAVIFTVSMTLVQTVLTGIQTFKKD